MSKSKNLTYRILAEIDVRVGGTRPWDLQVHNDAFYGRVTAAGALGLGASYMDRWWDFEQIDDLRFRLLRHDLTQHVKLCWSMFAFLFIANLIYAYAKGLRPE